MHQPDNIKTTCSFSDRNRVNYNCYGHTISKIPMSIATKFSCLSVQNDLIARV